MTTDLGYFTIHPVLPGDADEIARMAAELSKHEGSPLPLVVAEDVSRELGRPDCVLQGHMALQDGRVVGYALYSLCFDTESGTRGAYMCDLYVRPEARRNGLARALMAALAEQSAAQGGEWVSWGVLASNEVAQRFYSKIGCPEAGVELWSASDAAFAQLKAEGRAAKTYEARSNPAE